MKKLITALSLVLCATLSWATLSTDYEPAQYDTNGSVTSFAAQWGFFNTTDLIVTYTDSDGVNTVLTEGSGAGKYTVYAPNQDYSNGATITTGTTYPSSGQITIERSVPEGQDLSINGDFIPAKPLETQLDKLAAQIQQVSDQQVRSIKFPATDPSGTTYDVGTAISRAGKALGFDEDGSVTELVLAQEGGAFTAVNENTGLTASAGTISGKVDDDTLAFSSGNFAIKAGGVDTTQLADGAVTTAKMEDGSVTTAKLFDGDVTTAKIDDEAVTLAKMADLSNLTVIGRTTAGSGVPEEVVVDTDLSSVSASDDTVASAKAIKSYADGTFSTNSVGYAIFPSGLVIQWGTEAVAGDATDTVSLPYTNTTATLNVIACYNGGGNAIGDACTAQAFSTSQIKVTNGSGTGQNIFWQAIGY